LDLPHAISISTLPVFSILGCGVSIGVLLKASFGAPTMERGPSFEVARILNILCIP
jgi:hypothetical protein